MHSLAHVRRHESGRVTLLQTVLTVVVVAALAGGTLVAWRAGALNTLVCGGPCGPEAVAAPASLDLDETPGRPTPDPTLRGVVDAAAVRAAIEPLLDDADLGGRVGAVVTDLDGGVGLAVDATSTFAPASTTKLLVAYAALSLVDPTTRFRTSVVRAADGRVVLVGGGDPYLAAERPDEPTRVDRADLTSLATRTAEALRAGGVTEVELGYDASLFTGPAESEGWEDSYVPGQIVTPVSALWADQGVVDGVRSSDPARAAADRFAAELEDAGVEVTGDVEEVEDEPGATTLASASSAMLSQIVDAVLVRSDNDAAEVLLRHVAIAAGQPASFEGGAAAVVDALAADEVPVRDVELFDGSGLSRDNRVTPTVLADVVRLSAQRASTSELLASLPVGGLTGTLQDRYGDDAAADGAGLVRAKTGTLTGIHALAGYVTDQGGHPLVFALTADDTEGLDPFATQAALDRVAAALASCDCASDAPAAEPTP